MKPQKNTRINGWENVKMRRQLVQRLRKNKQDTGVPIVTFVEKSVVEKLERDKK